ncbi:MAG TPA: hypothetical protein VGD42_16785 [Lysobacter sp.]
MKPLGLLLCLSLTVPFLTAASAAASGADQAAPAGSCGRISVFDVAPRSQELYRAKLINIDGRPPGPSGARTYRVTPGRHVLEVAEAIDNEQFNDVQLRQRVQRADRYKTLEVDVAPGTTYLLAARLVLPRRNYIADGSYWEPVIYHQKSEPCQ